MRIGIDARLWNETGVGRYIRNLVAELQSFDKENTYVLFFYKDVPRDALEEIQKLKENNPRWEIIFTDIKWHSLKEQYAFPKLLLKEQLDLVHFPYFSVPILYNRPFVITIHDLIVNHYPTGKASTLPLPIYYLKHFAYKNIIKTAAKKACKIITVSNATKKEIIQLLQVPDKKITVTYEGIDTKTQKIHTNVKIPFNNYFLYVGNAYPHKNTEILIDIFQEIADEFKGTKLVIVGPDNYFSNKLKKIVQQKKLQNTVHFTGRIDDDLLSMLYENAHALITPSFMEGFGLPGLEAMHHNCLVLASDIPVYKEVYQDAAIYFNPHSAEEIHATIRSVLSDKKKYTENRRKGQSILTKYSWKEMTKETIKIYESCIDIRSGK